jgi:putative transposase
MKKSKFSEHQIVNILKEYESGKSTRDICREHGISAPTFYQWKQKYGGMDAQHLKELKSLPAPIITPISFLDKTL